MSAPSSSKKIVVGFTFDLKSEWKAEGFTDEECGEFENDITVESIAATLESLGFKVDQIGNARKLMARLVDIQRQNVGVRSSDIKYPWDIVFNICEGPNGTVGREAQVPCILENVGIPFVFSDSATLATCLDKARTKMVLQFYQIPTAPFAVVPNPLVPGTKKSAAPTDPDFAHRAIQSSMHHKSLVDFPLFAKPVAEGSSKGVSAISKIKSASELNQNLVKIMANFPGQDVLLETFLSGREFTVGLLGSGESTEILGVSEVIYKPGGVSVLGKHHSIEEQTADFYTRLIKTEGNEGNNVYKDISKDPMARKAGEAAKRAWQVLGCHDAGRIDVRFDVMDEAVAVANIIEVNPLAGLQPDFSDLPIMVKQAGIAYPRLLEMIVGSALKRYGIVREK
ncbi:hypothetical protein HDU97_009719 [Phlyctochytrium planicorne]|nr:hypothetical protein HDU97_009719 [Phlyctochytrium planicorne]